jgi:hypothetical protein
MIPRWKTCVDKNKLRIFLVVDQIAPRATRAQAFWIIRCCAARRAARGTDSGLRRSPRLVPQLAPHLGWSAWKRPLRGRLADGREVIQIAQSIDDIPFDLHSIR